MIKNDTEYYKIFGDALKQVMDEVIEKVYIEYTQLIYDIVYFENHPSTYERTYEFGRSWNYNTQYTMTGAVGEIYQDVGEMHYNSDKLQHGSYLSGNSSEYLTELIYQGLSGPIFGDGYWTSKRDAWTPLINELNRTGKDKLHKWFVEACDKRGFNIFREGAGGQSKYWS